MRENLKNELVLLLDKYVDTESLREIVPQIEIILSDYEVERRNTEIIPYGSDIPETLEIYIVSKKIAGLSDKTLYLYKMVLVDFFQTVQKKQEDITAMDIKAYLYRYQKSHGMESRIVLWIPKELSYAPILPGWQLRNICRRIRQ